MKFCKFVMKILKTIEKYQMIKPKDHVVVGLSGGADSVTLLHVLCCLKDKLGIDITAVHVNHGIRGEEAQKDEEFAKSLCNKLGIGIEIYGYDVLREAKEAGQSIELAGRKVRQRAFNEVLKSQQAQLIALGHNLDDNAETVLMRILRGTATSGLVGIKPKNGKIIRPLIETSRREIERYCDEKSIQYKIDSTNQSREYTRNKIRHELMPNIRDEYNPNINETLHKMTYVISAENDYLEEMTGKAFEETAEIRENKLILSIAKLSRLHKAIQRRLIRKALEQMARAEDIYNEHIEMVLWLMTKISGKRLEICNKLVVEREYESLIINKKTKTGEKKIYKICYDEPIYLKEIDKYLFLSKENREINERNVCTKAINYDKIKNSVQIRTRQPGDKIYLKSIGGHKKISDFFSDKKLAKEKRDNILLLADAKEIIMILDESMIVSDKYKPQEKNILYASLYEAGGHNGRD